MQKLNSPRFLAIFELDDERILEVLNATPNKTLREALNRAPGAAGQLLKMPLSPKAARFLQEDLDVFPIGIEDAAKAQYEMISVIEEVVWKTGYKFASKRIKEKRRAVQWLFSEIAALARKDKIEIDRDLILAFKDVTYWALSQCKHVDQDSAARSIAKQYLECALADVNVSEWEKVPVRAMHSALEIISQEAAA